MFKKVCACILALLLLLTAGCGAVSEGSATAAATATATATTTATATATEEPTPSPAPKTVAATVLFINVGEGDAALVQADGKSYLIDTGRESSVPELYRALALMNVTHLDGVFLSHKHHDHTGGLTQLVKKCTVDMVYRGEYTQPDSDGADRIDGFCETLGLDQTKLAAGDTVAVSDDVWFEALGPLVYNAEDDNNNSLVLKLHIGDTTILFAGDMQTEEETTLLGAGADLSADVLKVGHHGIGNATSNAFGSAVSPALAVVSGGRGSDWLAQALEGATLNSTLDCDVGLLLTVYTDGVFDTSNLQAEPNATADVSIQSVDVSAQTIVLVNNGSTDADISGWFIYSEDGFEVYVFPEGTVLAAGDTITVAAKNGKGDYRWDKKEPWDDGADEAALLYDAAGNEVARLQVGAG